MSTGAVVSVEGLERSFGALRALDGVTFEVPAGCIFGYLGPNGSGKTTTMRILLGMLRPSAGRVTVLGSDPWTEGSAVRGRCGVVMEHTGLYERLSAEANLEFFGRAYHMDQDELRGRERELLEHVGLWERRKEPVGKWSRGMRQRLAIVRALLHRPSLLLLDEPTSGLDAVATATFHQDLLDLVRPGGTTVFFTTHNLDEAEKLCDQVAILREGKLLALGSPQELRAKATAPRLEISGRDFSPEALAWVRSLPQVAGASATDGRLVLELKERVDAGAIVAGLSGFGVHVDEMHQGAGDLEEAFLKVLEQSEDKGAEVQEPAGIRSTKEKGR